VFQLSKTWVDPEPGIGNIEVRFTWTAKGGTPAFDGDEEAEVMAPLPGTEPVVRSATIEIPRYVDGADSYLLHYRFALGGETMAPPGPVITEEIVAREVDYLDAAGDITEVRLLWSVDGTAAPNWTQATVEGLPAALAHTTPDPEQEGLTEDATYELVQTLPLPRRYVAKVWGPRGASVEYRYQLLRTHSPVPDDDFERWVDDGGRPFRVTMG
jgi:hypothetical protein